MISALFVVGPHCYSGGGDFPLRVTGYVASYVALVIWWSRLPHCVRSVPVSVGVTTLGVTRGMIRYTPVPVPLHYV